MENAGCNVVVLEDDPIISWDLKRQLDKLLTGEIQYFEDQEQTDVYLRSHKPDLIITNLRLLDGWIETAHYDKLRSAANKLLILTGLRDERLHPALDTLEDHSFLYKPFTSLQLKNCIEKLCVDA